MIEFQGKQHFQPVRFVGQTIEDAQEKFISLQKRDKIKRVFCQTNNIPMIEIPYWKITKISEIIMDFIV